MHTIVCQHHSILSTDYCSDHLLLLHSDDIVRMKENLIFSLEQNGENLMILLEIDLEQFGTHLKKVRKSNFLMI